MKIIKKINTMNGSNYTNSHFNHTTTQNTPTINLPLIVIHYLKTYIHNYYYVNDSNLVCCNFYNNDYFF